MADTPDDADNRRTRAILCPITQANLIACSPQQAVRPEGMIAGA
jgi:hypothetical protein